MRPKYVVVEGGRSRFRELIGVHCLCSKPQNELINAPPANKSRRQPFLVPCRVGVQNPHKSEVQPLDRRVCGDIS
jgi:hypothetical protein